MLYQIGTKSNFAAFLNKLPLFILKIVLTFNPWWCFVVARCQSDSDSDADAELVAETVEEGADLGIVGDDAVDFGGGNYSPAPGVETVCIFPKNLAKSK